MPFYAVLFIFLIGSSISSCNSSVIDNETIATQEKENNLFVFVGEKISIEPLPYKPGDFDAGIKAKYLVLEKVYGIYNADTIEFKAYDHFGRFNFTGYINVLLYVSIENGQYYHERYLYDPLFKTADGRWAGPYSDGYNYPLNDNSSIKPERIEFLEEVSFPLQYTDTDGKQYDIYYPKPYYQIKNDRAIVIYGNYIPELFLLKKEGVLMSRKKELEIIKIEMEDISN